MTDVFSKSKRSDIMARVRGKDTTPEKAVRGTLKKIGLHFRTQASDLPGKPDLVLDDHRIAVFVNGCFWHGHPNCKRAHCPEDNREFWERKLKSNRRRDLRNTAVLRRSGWKVVTFWTCKEPSAEYVARRLKRVGVRGSLKSVKRKGGST